MELHLKLQLWSPSCSDADGWIINQTDHSEAALENRGLSALHSCHTRYVPPRRKDIHGLMVRRPARPFSVPNGEETLDPLVPKNSINSGLVIQRDRGT